MLLTLGQVGNEGRNVLFELCQIQSHVILVELRVFIVLLVVGHIECETAVVELGDHGPAVVSNAGHLVLNFADLVLFGINLVFAVVYFVLQICLGFLLLLGCHVVELCMLLELFVDVLVLFFDHVNLTVEHIDIIEERNVLLLCLDECRYDFVH